MNTSHSQVTVRFVRSAAVLASLFLFACSTAPEPKPVDRTHVVDTEGDPPEEGFDWQHEGPLEFLAFLRQGYVTSPVHWVDSATPPNVALETTVWGIHHGWLRPEDVPALLERLDDDTPCLGVRMARCSFISFGQHSSIGREAAFLIEGLRTEEDRTSYRGYPPMLRSIGWAEDFEARKAELRAWWKERSR